MAGFEDVFRDLFGGGLGSTGGAMLPGVQDATALAPPMAAPQVAQAPVPTPAPAPAAPPPAQTFVPPAPAPAPQAPAPAPTSYQGGQSGAQPPAQPQAPQSPMAQGASGAGGESSKRAALSPDMMKALSMMMSPGADQMPRAPGAAPVQPRVQSFLPQGTGGLFGGGTPAPRMGGRRGL